MHSLKNNGKNRNIGIDFLRLIAMTFVIVLHSLGHGGILGGVSEGSIRYRCAWLLEIIAYVGVDIFALISGYVTNASKNIKRVFINYLLLWSQVVFYNLIVSGIIGVVDKEEAYTSIIVKSFFPNIYNAYWYFTAYTGMIFLLPFILIVLRECPTKYLRIYLFFFVLVFSTVDVVTRNWIPYGGYSFVWLSFLFFLGMVIKKCNLFSEVSTSCLILLIILLYSLIWGWKQFGVDITLMDITITKDLFISYTSPPMLVISILYIVIFSRLQFGKKIKRIITVLAPGTFAAYLINDNKYFREFVITNSFSCIIKYNILFMIGIVIMFSVLFVVMAAVIDLIRQYVFKYCQLEKRYEYLLDKVYNHLL